MLYKRFGTIIIAFFLCATAMYGQENVFSLLPYNGDPATYINTQIAADTVATGGLLADRVYELQRGQIYLSNAIMTFQAGQTIRLRAAAGDGAKPVVYLWETGTGQTPTRPPGNFIVLNGANLEMKNICVAGYYEPEESRIDGVQGGLINTTAIGSSIILDGVVLSNINGQHVRTGFNAVKVEAKNSIFANMGTLSTSNLGAGKGFDFREAAIDTLIIQNNTFVNYQDRAIRHYNFSNPSAGTGEIKYGKIDHNTFVNGMGFHGLFSLGNVGDQILITNNLFVDGFALGEDPTDTTRAAEWANTGEFYDNGRNRITWIFTAPNEVTQWTIGNNYYSISDSGHAFLNDFGYQVGSQLSWHINSRLALQGVDTTTVFREADLTLQEVPRLMTNMMRWYEDPLGGGRIKSQTNYVRERDDYDRRVIQYYRDTLNASYSTSSEVYTGGENGYPAGDLNWFPDKKAQWEAGIIPFALDVDGEKDEFYNTLTGPADGYLQIRSFAHNDNGRPDDDTDLSAKVWTGWNENWFYLYAEVKDDTVTAGTTSDVWATDNMELKFDPQAKDSVTNSIWDTRLTAPYDKATPIDTLSTVTDPANKKWVKKLIDGGYAFEMAIRWPAVGSTEKVSVGVDSVFGMAINFHDNDGAARKSSVTWAAFNLDAVYNTVKYLGTVKFLPDNKLMFIPTNNVTGRTNHNFPYDGSDEPVGVEDDNYIPYIFALEQNYPNPFNPSTRISFTLEKEGHASLTVYNVLGQKVATILSQELQAGQHFVNFNASNLATGLYFYKLESGSNVSTKKMMLLK